jgi:hypothetical protein
MDHHTNDTNDRDRHVRSRASALLACSVLGVGLLAAACSGGSPSPKVANLGTTTTIAAGSAAGASGGGSPSGMSAIAQMQAYANCMRSHGIHDFPDPTPKPDGQGGGFSIQGGPGSDLNPDVPQFKAARQACSALMPGQNMTPAQTADALAAAVKLAACMRSHGVPRWPDPDNQGAFDLTSIDRSTPQVSSALNTCETVTGFHGPMRVHGGSGNGNR